jgi:hypothetical protein
MWGNIYDKCKKGRILGCLRRSHWSLVSVGWSQEYACTENLATLYCLQHVTLLVSENNEQYSLVLRECLEIAFRMVNINKESVLSFYPLL